MRRRRRLVSGKKTLLGGYIGDVEMKIANKIKDEVALLCPFNISPQHMIEGCVDQRIIAVLTEAKRYKDGYDRNMGTIPFNDKLSFDVDFHTNLNMLVPKEEFITMQPALRANIATWRDDMLAIYRKWMVVRYVAKWFDNNASFGAVRYYWPSMMALLPEGCTPLQNLHNAGLEKYKEPFGISKMLHLVRKTATTVTAGQMLPKRSNPSPVRVKCSIASHIFWYNDAVAHQHEIDGEALTLEF